jgi:hypothetical protein
MRVVTRRPACYGYAFNRCVRKSQPVFCRYFLSRCSLHAVFAGHHIAMALCGDAFAASSAFDKFNQLDGFACDGRSTRAGQGPLRRQRATATGISISDSGSGGISPSFAPAGRPKYAPEECHRASRHRTGHRIQAGRFIARRTWQSTDTQVRRNDLFPTPTGAATMASTPKPAHSRRSAAQLNRRSHCPKWRAHSGEKRISSSWT